MIQRQIESFALDRVEKRRGDIEVQRVAKLIWLRSAAGLDAGRQIARIVAPEARLAERAQQIS